MMSKELPAEESALLRPSPVNAASLPKWMMAALREEDQNSTCSAPGSFYIYEMNQCAQQYKGMGRRFLNAFQRHPCRTTDPEQADLVFAAFSMKETEIKGNDLSVKTTGKHLNCLVLELMKMARSDRWMKQDGRDFFFHYESPMAYVHQASPISNFIINGDMMDPHYAHAAHLQPFLDKFTLHNRKKAADVLRKMTVLSVEPPTNVQLVNGKSSCYKLMDENHFHHAYGIPYQVGSELVHMARSSKLAAGSTSTERDVILAGAMGAHGHDMDLRGP